jgi:hypothetical protein
MGVVKKDEVNPQINEENPPVVVEETPPTGVESQQSTETPPGDAGEKQTYTTEEYESMLAKARKEAGNYRTKNKANEEALKARNEELARYQQEEKDKELADKSELEKAELRIAELEGENTGLKTDVLSATKSNVRLQITSQVDKLMASSGRQFRSAYERDGFLRGVTAQDENGVYKTAEEVEAEVSAFLDATFEGPPPVPKNPKVEAQGDAAQLMNRIKTLMAKRPGTMTQEEVQELKDAQAQYQAIASASVAEGNRATTQPKSIFPNNIDKFAQV